MLPLAHRIAFLLFASVTVTLGLRGFLRVYAQIRRGREDADPRLDHPVARVWYAFRTTLLQDRVFRRRVGWSVFHSFIFYAFVVYLAVNLVDAIDGFYPIRFTSAGTFGVAYGALADSFSVLALVGVIALLLRRYLLPARRDFAFNARTLLHPAVRDGSIRRDSLIVSGFILLHVSSRAIGNAARLAMEGAGRFQPFSHALVQLFVGHDPEFWRIFGYWGALGSVLLFLVYFPYSKHMHLFMAPVKYLVHREALGGVLPAVTLDLEATELHTGAEHLADLTWPRLVDAYACIQCNRCQDVCPASVTGKALSPSALEINKRMVLNASSPTWNPFATLNGTSSPTGGKAGPALLEAILPAEAAWACTTCGACLEVCPTQDEPMLDIIDIRRNQVMVKGEFPAQLQTAFRGMERQSNPWGMAREKRMAWADGLAVPTTDEVPEPDVLYWVGCAASYDPGAQKTARATVQLLQEAKVNFAVLGKRESCTGDSARRAGNELLYQELAQGAIQTLAEVHPKQVIASCPHCVNILGSEYPQLGGNFTVTHHTEYLDALVREGRLTPAPAESRTTFHDPCYLGRHRGSYEEPRSLLNILSNDFVELERNRENAFCCGAGGAQFWKEEEAGEERIAENRLREAQKVLKQGDEKGVLAVGCPFCKSMLDSTSTGEADTTFVIKDVAELLWEGVQRSKGSLVPLLDKAAPVSLEVPEAQELTQISVPTQLTPVVAAHEFPAPVETQETPVVVSDSEAQKQVRKKWAPGRVQTTRGVVTEEVEVAPPQPGTGTSSPRQRCQPRKAVVAPTPEHQSMASLAPPPETSTPAPAPPPDPVAVPERKKWQPKSKL